MPPSSTFMTQLIHQYGFPEPIAQAAVETYAQFNDSCTLQMLVNHVLEKRPDLDHGGAVEAIKCIHTITELMDPDDMKPLEMIWAATKKDVGKCNACGDAGENWLCLTCGAILCSRYRAKHALAHYNQSPSHFLALSLSDLSVYCYKCDAYIMPTGRVRALREAAYSIKHDGGVARNTGATITFTSQQDMHGRDLANCGLDDPIMTRHVDTLARPGYQSMSASEFQDTERTLHLKIQHLAKLLQTSRNTVIYSGAGISTSSGIGDYATSKSGGGDSALTAKIVAPLDARPTLCHRMLVALTAHPNTHIGRWVNQNHDGLGLKAGFPLHLLNEIHGAWFDPTNPVVPMSGTLRTDLIEDLVEWENKSDLCLALGSSLCGMNADRLVTSNAERHAMGKGLGSVIISLQRTVHDGDCALRIFAKLDDIAELLAQEMNFTIAGDDPAIELFPPVNAELIFPGLPYHPITGLRIPAGSRGRNATMTLDLRDGAKVRLINQPGWDRAAFAKWDKTTTIEADKGCVGEVVRRRGDGHFVIRIAGVKERVLGSWWVKAAMEGTVERLPVVNV